MRTVASVLMYEEHAWPHLCFPMITWQLSTRMIAMTIKIHVVTMYIHFITFTECTIFYLCSIGSPVFKALMHRFTNAQIHRIHYARIH